ncbi:MAG: hypothetical protein IJV29_06285 [Butyrivibrio sp.]|nr:hypothetical protein [Butyrivibrio sp.]
MIKFSEMGLSDALEGSKMSINDVIGHEIVITGAENKPSKFKAENYLTIQFYFLNDENKTKHIVFTGSEIIKKNIEQAKEYCKVNNEEFEVQTKIVQTGKFYTLV